MIKENVAELLKELPPQVELLAATKTRTPEEVQEAADTLLHCVTSHVPQGNI